MVFAKAEPIAPAKASPSGESFDMIGKQTCDGGDLNPVLVRSL